MTSLVHGDIWCSNILYGACACSFIRLLFLLFHFPFFSFRFCGGRGHSYVTRRCACACVCVCSWVYGVRMAGLSAFVRVPACACVYPHYTVRGLRCFYGLCAPARLHATYFDVDRLGFCLPITRPVSLSFPFLSPNRPERQHTAARDCGLAVCQCGSLSTGPGLPVHEQVCASLALRLSCMRLHLLFVNTVPSRFI